MACILKVPTLNSKGVVVFTTQDRDKFILNNLEIKNRINSLKHKWSFGLHHNWHDFRFNYDSTFDFSMAGESDLIEINGTNIPLIPLDACNFSPTCFHYSKNQKFWDILYVGKAVNFKKIPEFFNMIRKLYDQGIMYRVLLIAPIPDECKNNNPGPTVYCNIRNDYDKFFSEEEKNIFTLLTTDYRNPFPFDVSTISQFYKLSKVFVHSADEERRCRVAGYAWACGMPVVSMKSVASLLPKEKQIKPFSYIASRYDDFTDLIVEAVSFVNSDDYNVKSMQPCISETSQDFTQDILKQELSIYCNNIDDDFIYNFNNLDIRLGRHHGQGENINSIGWGVDSLLNYLEYRSMDDMLKDIKNIDPERYITKYTQYGLLKKDSLYIQKRNGLKDLLLYFYLRFEFLQKFRKRLRGF
jgi:hypothetical protein